MTNAQQTKHHHYQDAFPVVARANANHSSRVSSFGNNKNNNNNSQSSSRRLFYVPPSLTRLPNLLRNMGDGQQQVSSHQVFSIEDTIINSNTQHARMRSQSTGGVGSEGSFVAPSSSSYCNNVFSLTPAFPQGPPHQAAPSPQVLSVSLHRRNTCTPRALRRGSKNRLQQQRPQQRSSSLLSHPKSHVQVGSLSLAQIQARAQEEEQHHHSNHPRPRKQQRSISLPRRTRRNGHGDYHWDSNATVHNRNRSHSPTPSFASSSSSGSSVVTNTTKQSSMMSIASSRSPSLAHQSHQATASSSQAPESSQVPSPVPSSQAQAQAQAQQVMIPSSSSQVEVPSLQAQATLPSPLWTDQFASDVTTTIQQKVDVMIQNGNLPVVQSNNTFCDTLTPLDIVRSDDDVLGSGAFSNVTRVSIRTMNNNKSQSQSPSSYQPQYFALKSLQRGLLPKVLDSSSSAAAVSVSISSTAAADDEEEVMTSTAAGFIKAAQELAREAYLLSRLDHAHIISIQGWTLGGVASYQTYKRHDAFFLLLELLETENLADRIARWNQEDETDDSITHQYEQKVEQLTICRQVANALEYIHSKNVVYRDLKPQNIGFGRCIQEDGQHQDSKNKKIHVKLMDFGLARELPSTNNSNGRTIIVPNQEEEQQQQNNNIHKRNSNRSLLDMTGMVGTIRYMSPEIYLHQPYGVEADIYSWSIVAYEIFSKTCPYHNMTPDLYHSFVCHQGVRPNTWYYMNQQQQQQQQQQSQGQGQCQHDDVPAGQLLPSEYLVLLANAWRTNPANRWPLHRIQRQLDLFIQQEQLLYEAKQLVVTQHNMPTNNNNNEPSVIPQSFSYYDNMGLTTTGQTRQQGQRHCGSSSSSASAANVANCGTKRSRRFVDAFHNNSSGTFPTQEMNMMQMNAPHMLRPCTMNTRNHNQKHDQQHHYCDVMHAARNILSNDPMIDCHAQKLQSQRSPSDFQNGIMNHPQQQQQQQFQQQQQQQETMCPSDRYYLLQQQQQKEQRFLQEQQELRAFTMRMMMTNTNTNNNNNNSVNGTNNNNRGGGSIQKYRRSISMPNEGSRKNGINNRRTNN